MTKQTHVPNFMVRFAEPEDAPALARLVDTGAWKVDWTGCSAGWLVAVRQSGEVVGALMLYLGKPIGRTEFLSLRADLHPREKHEAALLLARVAVAALTQSGSQIVTVFCSFADKGFKRLIKKHFGARVTNSGNMLSVFVGA